MILLRSAVFLYAFCFAFTSLSAQISPQTNEVKIENAGIINSPNLEFSPTFYQNGIVYATSRYNSGKRDEKINETFFELFYAELDQDGNLYNPKPFSINVNSQLHEGPVTFSRDFQTMYFTRNNTKKGLRKADSKGVTRLKVYEGQRGSEDWEKIVELPFNSDEYSVAHPTLSTNGDNLFFTSDMPGGYGGMDLYVVSRADGVWGNPVNLGSTINTADNEVFPFIHTSGTLFFSSDGHDTMGGLDLFMANGVDADWREVVNLGPQYNSGYDDLGIILDPDGTAGYFSSNRNGGNGKDDIYRFEVSDGIAGKTKAKSIDATILVYDERTTEVIEGAFIRIFENTPEGYISGGKSLYDAVLMPGEDDGDLTFKLVRKDKEALGNPDRISNSQGEAGYAFVGEKTYLIVVSKDGYDSAEFEYKTIGNKGANVVEVPLKKTICIDMAGTVRNKITNTSIPNAIINIWNSCDGSDKQIRTNSNGEFDYCLQQGCDFLIKGYKDTYNAEYEKITTNNSITSKRNVNLMLTPTSVSAPVPVRTFVEGSVIVLENIYYDFNKSHIRTGAARELDELYSLLSTYPSMQIELISHTDTRGREDYNLKLSKRRADSAKQFLVNKGITSSRIKSIGMGESQPRIRCANCTEEEHQNNRRTEVRIIQINESVKIQYQNNSPEVIDRKRN